MKKRSLPSGRLRFLLSALSSARNGPETALPANKKRAAARAENNVAVTQPRSEALTSSKRYFAGKERPRQKQRSPSLLRPGIPQNIRRAACRKGLRVLLKKTSHEAMEGKTATDPAGWTPARLHAGNLPQPPEQGIHVLIGSGCSACKPDSRKTNAGRKRSSPSAPPAKP